MSDIREIVSTKHFFLNFSSTHDIANLNLQLRIDKLGSLAKFALINQKN